MNDAGERLQLIALSFRALGRGTSKACAALHSLKDCMSIVVFMLAMDSAMSMIKK
jgi:hypothetical protein